MSNTNASTGAQGEVPYTDEPVPSYETAIKQGAGGAVPYPDPSAQSAAASSYVPSSTPQSYSYGSSPYTANGATRIIILPAAQAPHGISSRDSLLPAPVSLQQTGRRARPRFFIALMHAILIYILINVLVDFIFVPRR